MKHSGLAVLIAIVLTCAACGGSGISPSSPTIDTIVADEQEKTLPMHTVLVGGRCVWAAGSGLDQCPPAKADFVRAFRDARTTSDRRR